MSEVQPNSQTSDTDTILCEERLAENFSKTSKSSYSSPPKTSNNPKTEKILEQQNSESTEPKQDKNHNNPLNKDSVATENVVTTHVTQSNQSVTTLSPCVSPLDKTPFGLGMISKARESIGNRYLNLSKSMDSVFSGDDSDTFVINESYLRLSTQATAFENGSFDQDITLRAKLDLPKTQHRFQLFYDSRFEQDESLEDRKASASSGERVNRRDSVAGLEYGRNKKGAKWRYGIRVGARTGVPLRMFTRLRLERRWVLSEVFSTKLQQDIWYLDGTGFGETTYFDLKTKLSERSYLLNQTEIQYEDEKFPISYYHSLNMFYRISDRSRIRYGLGAIGSDDKNAFIDRYFIDLAYTYRLYKEWLYISLIPEVLFRAQFQTDNEFYENPMPIPDDFRPWDPEASFTLKFDIFTN